MYKIIFCFMSIFVTNFFWAYSVRVNVESQIRRLKLAPSVVTNPPIKIARLYWEWGEITSGENLRPDQVLKPPRIEWYTTKGLFTLYVVGARNPTQDNITRLYLTPEEHMEQWPVWVIANIPGYNLPIGEEILKYTPPRPSDNPNILHRYGIFIYKQTKPSSFTPTDIISGRASQNLSPMEAFIHNHSLGDPVYGNCFSMIGKAPNVAI